MGAMAELLKKNTSYEFTIESLCGNGNGVAKHDGFVVFIPNTAPSDRVRAKVIKVTKSYAVAKLEEVLSPAPCRFDDGCPLAARCGGCAFQHITYERECEIKRTMIDDSFEHIAKLPLRVSRFVGADDFERYRNKVIYPIGKNRDGKLCVGFYAPQSHRIVEHDDCRIGKVIFGEIKKAILLLCERYAIEVYEEETQSGILRGLYMRSGENNTVLLTLIAKHDRLDPAFCDALCKEIPKAFPSVCGILLNINPTEGNSVLSHTFRTLWGQSFLYDTLCGKRFRIAPDAFYQVNHAQTEKLYALARSFADVHEGDTLFDLYCGTGTIGIILAEKNVRLIGVEISESATENAAENARANAVDGEFICLDAGEALNSERLLHKAPDVIVIDPPRKGCGTDAAAHIASFDAARIVYISCNPQTLARDLVTFEACGYHATEAVGVDLFPRTGHVETVVLLNRKVHTHAMKLAPAPFESMKSGQKTIELRLFDEKRQKLRSGDTILFTNTESGETFTKTVTKLHRFESFAESYRSLPLLRCGYTEKTVADAKASDMDRYYSPEQQRAFGVVGIELA